MSSNDRVLVIDDDVELCELVTEFLQSEGFETESVGTGAEGVEKAVGGEYSLVVLDVMLPGMNGFEVLRRIRAQSEVPVLMLTARGEDVDRIVGLEIGADDYMPKPFNPRELVARIHAILRRTRRKSSQEAGSAPEVLVVGDIELDTGTRTVRRSGRSVQLTAMEFDVLEALLRSAGRVVSREELVREVLGREYSPYDRAIDVHVSSLRKKLGHEIEGVERIKAVRQVGYLYAKPGEVADESETDASEADDSEGGGSEVDPTGRDASEAE